MPINSQAEINFIVSRRPPSVTEFMQNDTDKDGKISKTEAPEQMQRFFETNDADKDGFLNETEVKAMVERMKAFSRPPEGGGGPSAAPGGQ